MALAPEFTPAILTDWMRQLFEEEIQREVAAHSTRERMIERLARGHANLDGSQLTTAELLKLGTVSIQKGKAPGRRFGRSWWMLLSLLSFWARALARGHSGRTATARQRTVAGSNRMAVQDRPWMAESQPSTKSRKPRRKRSNGEGGDPLVLNDNSEALPPATADSARLASVRSGF